MPRENRKRGKKHKKSHTTDEVNDTNDIAENLDDLEEQHEAGPSWIVQKREQNEDGVNPEAPFGYVDPDLKAYLRTVDEKLKEWQELREEVVDDGGDLDPNEGALNLIFLQS